MSYTEISLVLGSPLCRKILELLGKTEHPLTPLEISKGTGIARSNVSTKLMDLTRFKLVICVNPERRKWRFYKITRKGEDTLKEARRIKS